MRQEVRAITIRQPFAWAIATKRKRVENRTWNTSYRGELFIHAGMNNGDRTWVEATFGLRIPSDLPRGVIIATCNLVDVVTESDDPWFEGPFGFVLRNIRALPTPVSATGRLNLWRPTAGQIAAVRRQLGVGVGHHRSASRRSAS
jgi:hypothetical protein